MRETKHTRAHMHTGNENGAKDGSSMYYKASRQMVNAGGTAGYTWKGSGRLNPIITVIVS